MPKRLKPMKTDPNWRAIIDPAPIIDDNNQEWWSVDRIARDTGVDRQRVARVLAKKFEDGKVDRMRAIIKTPADTHNRAFVYRITKTD